MGVDKNDVRTVVHLAPPASVEAYLQETGRASRDGKGAEAWLIVTPEDMEPPSGVGDVSGDLRGGLRKDDDTGQSEEAVSEGDSCGHRQSADLTVPSLPDTDVLRSIGVEQTTAGKLPFPARAPSTPPDAEAIAQARRSAMISYAASTHHCRREMLLEALGIEAEDCTGCDVCGGEAWTDPPEREVILKVVRWNRGRFRKGQLARILIGRRTAEIRRTGLDLVRGFGMLAGWELEDAEEAIETLCRAGDIVTGRLSNGLKSVALPIGTSA